MEKAEDNRVRRYFADKLTMLFGIDLATLAFFRIYIALLILADLIVRSTDLEAHYSDFGVLPRDVLLDKFTGKWTISIHLLSGRWEAQAVLFVIAAVFAVMLLIGYKTRLATIMSWFFLMSLHSRNHMVLQGGDVLFRMLLFWSMFLPLGAYFSVDRALNSSTAKMARRYISAGTMALLAQTVFLYVFTALLKSGPEWRETGTATYMALSMDHFVTDYGKLILSLPRELLEKLTVGVWWFELLGPLLLFPLILTGPLRMLAVCGFIIMQMNFGLSLELGFFPWISTAAIIPFIPTWFWDQLRKCLGPVPASTLTLWVDQGQPNCRKVVDLAATFLLIPKEHLNWVSSEAINAKLRQDTRIWGTVEDDGRTVYSFDAFKAVLRHSPIIQRLIRVLSVARRETIGRAVYTGGVLCAGMADRFLSGLHYRSWTLKRFWLAEITAFFFLVYVFVWNMETVNEEVFQVPKKLRWVGYVTRVKQKWSMFSPRPPKDDGWYVIPGQFCDGSELDIYRGGQPVSWQKPESISGEFKNARWRKYMRNLWQKKNKRHRLYYGRYLCRKWNRRSNWNTKLKKFQIRYMREQTSPIYEAPTVKKFTVWKHRCFTGDCE